MLNDHVELQSLLQGTARGDQDAFAALYQATSARLFGVCLRILRNRAAAEDVLQDAFVKIWHHASEYHSERGTVLTWLTTIVRYRALDYLRRVKPEDELDEQHEEVVSERDGPFDWAVSGAEMEGLSLCLDELNDSQRQVIVLSFLEGLTHPELVKRVQSPLGTVKSWIRRGLQSLRRCLER